MKVTTETYKACTTCP